MILYISVVSDVISSFLILFVSFFLLFSLFKKSFKEYFLLFFSSPIYFCSDLLLFFLHLLTLGLIYSHSSFRTKLGCCLRPYNVGIFAIYFPLRIVFAASHRFFICCVSFSICFKVFFDFPFDFFDLLVVQKCVA